MYGILLESVQEYVIQECGEEIWLTILSESGAKHAVFNTHQHYPDTLMLRLASALARVVTEDPNSPSGSLPVSPVAKKKPSIKSRSSLRNSPGRPRTQSFKCPFSSAANIAEATKQHIASYHSSEEIYKKIAVKKTDTQFIAEYLNELMNVNKQDNKEVKEIDLKNDKICNIDTVVKPSTAKDAEEENASTAKELNQSSNVIDESDESPNVNDTCPNDYVQSRSKSVVSDICCPKDTKFVITAKDSLTSNRQGMLVRTASMCPRDSMLTSPKSERSRNNSMSTILDRRSSAAANINMSRRESSGMGSQRSVIHGPDCTCFESKAAELRVKFGTPEKVMHFFGRCFVKYFSTYGYDTFIRATGRYFCTFLQSVDNIHQRMRFTFPRMRSPTMQLARAHRLGAELIYSSTRHGFTHYLMGQLYEIAEDKFSMKLKVSILRESIEGVYSVVALRLEFDNSDYVQSLLMRKAVPCLLPAVPVSLLLQLFPFGLLFDRKMKVLMAGEKLFQVWGGPHASLHKCDASDILRLRKPKTSFTWDKVVSMQSVLFELELLRWGAGSGVGDGRRGSQGARLILLKGQMRLLDEIDAIIFLCSPIFNDLEELTNAGLFLADMNGHGLSRQLLLTGWQHCSKLELLFEKAEGRSTTLEKSLRLLDQWKKRGDQLLYSMIPKPIVDHLRAGKDPMAACQAFDCVTVMFCAVRLEETGSRAGVMHTVANINEVYSRIDRLLDSHRVYKVETVGSVYMAVAGAPDRSRAHAADAAGAALAVSTALPALTIGVHSGPCVAGVLGLRLPRYCIVGDTVNTASRMQTTSEPGRIHISAATASLLPAGRFRLRQRGLTKLKGKGMMETFWLEGEVEEDDQDEALHLFYTLCCDNA